MHSALLLLMRLRAKAFARRIRRSMRSPKGLLITLVGFFFMALWIGSVVFTTAANPSDPALLRKGYPVVMLMLLVFSVMGSFGERAIYFSPSEVDHLFTAPFSRRALLAYKLMQACAGLAFTALIFTFFALRTAPNLIMAYTGVFLSLVFINLLNVAVWMAGALVQQQIFSRVRAAIAQGLLGQMAAAGLTAYGRLQRMPIDDANEREVGRALNVFFDVPFLETAATPFVPFARTALAEAIGPFAVWAFVCVLMNAALFALIVRLDANYYERAAAISEKIYARMQQMRRGGFAAPAAKAHRRRVPMPPHWAGAGTLAWRQLVTASRAYVAAMAMPLAIGLAATISIATMQGDSGSGILIGVVIYLSIFMSSMLRFDFRSDLDVMPMLKTLPVRAECIALGQIGPPALVLTLIQTAVLAPAFVISGSPWNVPLALAGLLPVNGMLFAVDNALFLLAPVRMNAQSAGDPQYMGRQIIVLLLKFCIVGVAGLIAAGAGGGIWFVTRSAPAAWAAGWAVLCLEVAAMLPYVAYAFRTFDPATDTPE